MSKNNWFEVVSEDQLKKEQEIEDKIKNMKMNVSDDDYLEKVIKITHFFNKKETSKKLGVQPEPPVDEVEVAHDSSPVKEDLAF